MGRCHSIDQQDLRIMKLAYSHVLSPFSSLSSSIQLIHNDTDTDADANNINENYDVADSNDINDADDCDSDGVDKTPAH